MSRGEYGYPTALLCDGGWGTSIGAQLIDAGRALKQIDSELEAIVDALYRAMGADPAALRRPAKPDEAWMQRVLATKAKAQQSPLWAYWDASISPKYTDWQTVREGFTRKPMAAEDYDRWLRRVQQLRSEVKTKGITIQTADPVNLFEGQQTGVDSGKIVKWVAIGGSAIGALALLAALVSSTIKSDRRAGLY